MTIIYFVLVLGITIMIHELGHFLFAKKAGVRVFEFSLGMGPKIFSFKRKNDETIYAIRLFPIGGFVSMAGEDMEDENVPFNEQLVNKSWFSKFMVMFAGVLFNFLLAIILLFIVGLVNGVPNSKPVIDTIDQNYKISETNVEVNDTIIKINDTKINTTDMLVLVLQVNNGKTVDMTVKHNDGSIEIIKVEPTLIEKDNETYYAFGFTMSGNYERGIVKSIEYAFTKTVSLLNQMMHIIFYLITGDLSLNSLSGPIGIYNVVGASAAAGLINLVYLTAYLCINVGFVNLIPLPAFDGGRILFLIIEKIKGSRINPKVENMIHSIGLMLLIALMILVSYNDIIKIFN